MQSFTMPATAFQVIQLLQCLFTSSQATPITRDIYMRCQRFEYLAVQGSTRLLYIAEGNSGASSQCCIGLCQTCVALDIAARQAQTFGNYVQFTNRMRSKTALPVL